MGFICKQVTEKCVYEDCRHGKDHGKIPTCALGTCIMGETECVEVTPRTMHCSNERTCKILDCVHRYDHLENQMCKSACFRSGYELSSCVPSDTKPIEGEIDTNTVEEQAYRKAAICTIKKFMQMLKSPLIDLPVIMEKYSRYLMKEYHISDKDLK